METLFNATAPPWPSKYPIHLPSGEKKGERGWPRFGINVGSV
jgi:hypothetical protein